MKRTSKILLNALGAIGLMGAVGTGAQAGPILIVNGSSNTSEPTTTSNITNNVKSLHEAVGNTVTVSDGVPGDLSSFTEVWDLRFSNSLAVTSSEESQFLSFLQGGGGMFVMGENDSFTTRNNSVISLLETAGAGNFTFDVPNQPQTVHAPFNSPNPIADDDISFAAPGGVTSAGSCSFMTQGSDGSGTGVACSVGDMTNAMDGALTTVFDVNFMENTQGTDQQNFTKNLIGFVGQQVDPQQVPEPATLGLFGIGLAGIGFAAARRRKTA